MVIECCVLAVQFLSNGGPVCVENIEKVPKAVLHIVNGSLQHCTKRYVKNAMWLIVLM